MTTNSRRSGMLLLLITIVAAGFMLRAVWKASRSQSNSLLVSHHPRSESFQRASSQSALATRRYSGRRIQVVVFTDFNCHFCMMAEPAIEAFVTSRLATIDVHWRYLASALSKEAAKVARCNEDPARVFPVRSGLFEAVRTRRYPLDSMALLSADGCVSSQGTLDDLNKDRRDFSALSIRGVPAIVVGRTVIVGIPTVGLLDSAYAAESDSLASRRPPHD